MKYHAVWKPRGHPRRGMASMKSKRRQAQALKPRGAVLMKEVETLGANQKKAA